MLYAVRQGAPALKLSGRKRAERGNKLEIYMDLPDFTRETIDFTGEMWISPRETVDLTRENGSVMVIWYDMVRYDQNIHE